MEAHDDGGRSAMRAIGVAALALVGFMVSLLPVTERADASLLDIEWRVLRRFDPRPAPADIVIVGSDEATVASVPEPAGIWHATLGRALAKIASAKPRAIGLAHPLPERSYDGVKPGLDRALFEGLSAAVESGPFVAVLSIDARTRAAKNVHLPYLALLGESRLGIDLAARDADGVARRYALAVPTEDGGFPTLEGRLCRALKRACSEGLIHFALGAPFTYVPLKSLLAMTDTVLLERLFRDRIVLVGDAQAFTNRIDVPLNLAGWESEARNSPGIVVHAQTLRTALAGASPRQAPQPLVVILLSLAALVFLVRDPRMSAVTGLLLAAGTVIVATVALRGGVLVPATAVLFTLLLAVSARAAQAYRDRNKS